MQALRHYPLLVAAVVLLATAGAGSATSEPVLIGKPGLWTLSRLGYQAQEIPTANASGRISLPFRLAPGTARRSHRCYALKQPRSRRTCFLLHLHFLIDFSADTPEGDADVAASTNGRAAALAIFHVRRPNGDLQIEWNTLDWIRGYEPHQTSERSIEVRMSNYIQTWGLHGGLNRINFSLDRLAGTLVDRVLILPDSGLEWIRQPPGRLGLVIRAPRTAKVGKPFRVRYRVLRLSGRVLENISVRAGADADRAQVVGETSHHIEALRHDVSGVFMFSAVRAGRFKVGVQVVSPTSQPVKFAWVRAQQ